jgi:predicted N-acetyltransferase YhbS
MPASPVTIRPATPDDAALCGQICFDAFTAINTRHGYPCDFPAPEVATRVLTMMFSHPRFYCVVAESDGRIVGSNCLDERSTIAGVGPITIDPTTQNSGIGRALMRAVLDRAAAQNAAGVRLVQAAFHTRSLALYASLGFAIREPLACMQGRTTQRVVPGSTVRPASANDLAACADLDQRIHGFDRSCELADGLRQGTALVVERGNHITAYTSSLAFFGYSVAETDLDLQALLTSVEVFGGPGILVPMRNTQLFQWCLANGLRVTQLMTLMSTGLYNESQGAWLPSISF